MIKKENRRTHATTEHFCEDFGNNLTRIQVLSEILERKIRPADVEEKRLIGQIRNYMSCLWLGTRDMLWTLNHTGPTLGEMVSRLGFTGMEIFGKDSPVVFILENKISKPNFILLPDHCLNILIIFKEVMLACSKYPSASFIRVRAENSVTDRITFSLLSKGDDQLRQHLENKLDLLHIRKCASRMKATFSVDYSVSDLVKCSLTFELFG